MALPGVASAHSGLSGSAKKETSEKELLVVVNESANRTPDAAQDLFEKWICGEGRGAGSEPETGAGGWANGVRVPLRCTARRGSPMAARGRS